MALVINIKPPLTAPTLTLSRIVGGGNFTAGTYTFGIFASGQEAADGEADSNWNSPKTEQTIFLEAGDGVRFDWSNLDPLTVRIYVFIKRSNIYYECASGDDGYSYSAGFRIVNRPTGANIYNDTFGIRLGHTQYYESDHFFFGLRPDKGIGRIEVVSDVSFTIIDIIIAVTSSAMVQGEDYITMPVTDVIGNNTNMLLTNYALHLNNCNNCNFSVSGSILLFAGGIESLNSSCNWIANSVSATSVIFSSKTGGYGQSTNIAMMTGKYVVFPHLKLYYNKDGFLYGRLINNNTVVSNGEVTGAFVHTGYGGFSPSFIDSISVVPGIQSSTGVQPTNQKTFTSRIQTYAGTPNKYFKDQEIITGLSSYEALLTGNGTFSNYFLNCVFIQTSNNRILIPTYYMYPYTIDYGSPTNYHGATVKCNVVDINGAPLVDSNIKLFDKNNELVFDVNTDINGDIIEQDVYFYSIQLIPQSVAGIANDNNSIITNYNPYTLLVSKAGYQAYAVSFDIDSKIDWTISLKETTPTTGVIKIQNKIQGKQ